MSHEHDDSNPISVLVIDKTAVLPSVRDRWHRVGSLPDLKITLLAPAVWIENYREYRFEPSPEHSYVPVTGRVWPVGRELLAFYFAGLGRAFRTSRPDVVIMMEESFSVFGLQILLFRRMFAPRAPLVFYNNNITSYDLPGFRLSRLYRMIGKYVTPRCQLGLNVNATARDVLNRAGYDVPAEVLYYGTDEVRFSPGDRREARSLANVSEHAFIILYIGRLLEGKGVQDLIHAFELLVERSKRTDLRLLIVGDGPHRSALEAHVLRSAARSRIEMREGIPFDDVPSFMRSADVVVLPTRPELDEQFGRTNVEAMLVGTTVVGSTCGGIPEVIDDGGYLFEAGDASDLADVLTEILSHPEEARKRAETGRERSLDLYSIRAFVNHLAKTIRTLAGRRSDDVNAERAVK
jgi:glycosyltransferase involved in cell wall biosynthesis